MTTASARARVKYNNYAQTRVGNHSRGLPWTSVEDAAVLAHAVSDRELSRRLGRSVQAIQVRRTRLLSGAKG